MSEGWIGRVWTLLAASSALYFLADNEADNDLWVHLFAGRQILGAGAVPRTDTLSYTAAGAPWIDHEWLAQAAFGAVFDALGPTGLWIGKAAVALATAALLWRAVAARARSAWVHGPLLVLIFATLSRGYAVRPQIATYLAVAALLAWLDRADVRSWRWPTALAVGAAFALWANLHGGVVVGLGILALFAAAPVWPGSEPAGSVSPTWRSRMTVLASAAIGACLNPYGPALFTYIAGELRAPHPLTEWQPVDVTDPAHLPFLLLFTALVATLPFASSLRHRPWRAAVVAIVAAMALRHQRHIPLFAICAAAPLAEQAEAAFTWLRDRSRFALSPAAQTALATALLALAGVQIAVLSLHVARARGGIVYDASEYPVGALRVLGERRLAGNLALPLDWGGYALWHAAPAVRVSLDGRFATVYPERVVEDNFAFFRGDSARLLDAYDTTLVLVPRGVVTAVQARPEWRPLYADSVATLFGREPLTVESGSAPTGWLPFP